MKKYFENCKTIDDVKKLYRKLASQLHPDMNHDRDTTEEFQIMANEYETAYNLVKNIFVNAKGETYTKENTETPAQYADIINHIIHFENCKIEIIGTWIWVSGNTREYKDQLKELHFTWSKNKAAWNFHSEPFKKKSRNSLDFDTIRNFYGSSEIETQPQTKIS